MMKFLFALAVSLSWLSNGYASTPAQWVSTEDRFFLDSSVGFGDEVYYNCRDVEGRIQSFLKAMGARHIDVRCSGGIDEFSPPMSWQAFVELSFESLNLRENDNENNVVVSQWKPIDFWGTGSCYLYSQVFDEVKDSFSIRNLKRPWQCLSSSSSFQLELETLFQSGR